jgi:hypothetical protein
VQYRRDGEEAMTGSLERVIGIEDEVAPGDLEWLEHESYDDSTQLAVYVLEREGVRVRCIAPRDPMVRIGDIVDDYGSWFYAVQVATSSGSDEEIHFAESIRVRRQPTGNDESRPP